MMKNNEHLLSTRRFLPMFLTQFFGALNDNVYKQSLLLVITYGWISQQNASVSTLNNLAALLFIFAKRAAPFRGINLPLHRFGATDELCWCDPVAR